MRVLKIYIVSFLLGMFIITIMADFHDPVWVTIWAMWQKICHGSLLTWLCLYQVLRGEERLLVKPLYKYMLLFVAWEVTALFTGWSINSEYAVAVFFGLTALVIGYVALWRDTRLSRLLIRHLHL